MPSTRRHIAPSGGRARRPRAWHAAATGVLLGSLAACGGATSDVSAPGAAAATSPSPVSAPGPASSPASAPTIYGLAGKRPPGAAPLMGMNIGAKNYDELAYQEQLSRLDIVVLGFYPGWGGDQGGEVIRKAVQAIKSHNPEVLVGQYSVLSEAYADAGLSAESAILDRQGWWLRDAAGRQVQWTDEYGTWEVNITDFTAPDANGDRYPQWYAKWVDQRYFKPVPEFSFRYFDNFMRRSLLGGNADWRQDGVDVSGADPAIAAAYRRGQMASVETSRALAPAHRFQMVNLDTNEDPEYDGQLNAAYLEALIGKSWSMASWAGWEAMMQRYKTVYDRLAEPKVVGFNAWGAQGDYRAFRFGLTSALLGNGYYSHTLEETKYSTVPWFDEYEVPLGAAIDPWPTAAWQNGVWKRRYANALVLVNPGTSPREVDVGTGWQRFPGSQDTQVNSGAVVAGTLTLPAQDGVLLIARP